MPLIFIPPTSAQDLRTNRVARCRIGSHGYIQPVEVLGILRSNGKRRFLARWRLVFSASSHNGMIPHDIIDVSTSGELARSCRTWSFFRSRHMRGLQDTLENNFISDFALVMHPIGGYATWDDVLAEGLSTWVPPKFKPL